MKEKQKLKEYEFAISNVKNKISKINKLLQELENDIFNLEFKINTDIKERPQKLLLSWEETEKILGIGQGSLRYNLEQGKIKRVYLSKSRKPFKYEDVVDFVNNLEYITE